MRLPRLITDLLADLRDRKLLPLVLILPLAIVAVPLLMKQDPAAPPPVQAEAPVPEGVPSAAVLTATPNLRDYHERTGPAALEEPVRGRGRGRRRDSSGRRDREAARHGRRRGGRGLVRRWLRIPQRGLQRDRQRVGFEPDDRGRTYRRGRRSDSAGSVDSGGSGGDEDQQLVRVPGRCRGWAGRPHAGAQGLESDVRASQQVQPRGGLPRDRPGRQGGPLHGLSRRHSGRPAAAPVARVRKTVSSSP